MALTPVERALVIELATGRLNPSDGMQRHFLRVIEVRARPLTPREREWLKAWEDSRTIGGEEPSALQNDGGSRLCVDCEDAIPSDRLVAIPSAIRCVSCQNAFEKCKDFRKYVDEGLSGTRKDNKIERSRVWGEIKRRSRGQ
ncbi:MAG TPA: TraR/DksA C4-type zinc finger protein [Casimicrobiaceae bacterium]|nr:TraR/DksA C4-type zinc finger protein [Casimicrobiaceae bacterium]